MKADCWNDWMDIRECSALGKYSRCVASSLDNHRWSHSHSVLRWFLVWHLAFKFGLCLIRPENFPKSFRCFFGTPGVFHLLQSHFCQVTLPCRPNSRSAAEMVVLCKVLLELCQRDHQVSVPCPRTVTAQIGRAATSKKSPGGSKLLPRRPVC